MNLLPVFFTGATLLGAIGGEGYSGTHALHIPTTLEVAQVSTVIPWI